MTTLPARGLKHTCSSCEARFYDLGRQPPTCPKCGQVCLPVIKAPVRAARRSKSEPTAVPPPRTELPKAKYKPVKWKT